MALFLDGTLLGNNMDTSNFAHVIFQNVGKSYLPHAALECHYTLTQFIKPHPKDWVGIFKVNTPVQFISVSFDESTRCKCLLVEVEVVYYSAGNIIQRLN